MPRRTNGAPRLVSARVDTRTIVAVLACAALSAGVYMGFTGPMREQSADMAQQVATAQTALDRNTQRITDIRTGKKSGAAELYVQAQDLDEQMPASVDKIALVAAMSSLAAQKGISLGQMDPVASPEPATRAGVKSQSFTVMATGRADALAEFLDSVQSYPSTIGVSALTVNFADGQETTATFTLRAFYVTTPAVSGSR